MLSGKVIGIGRENYRIKRIDCQEINFCFSQELALRITIVILNDFVLNVFAKRDF
jgi:hypothetical protein